MTYEEQQAILRAMSSFSQDFTTHQTAKAKYANELDKLKFINEATAVTEKHQADTKMRADLLKAEISKNDAEIVNLLDDFDRWNFNYESWTKLDDNYKTKEGADFLKDLGVEYGEGFRLRESIAKDKTQQLDFRENLIGEQRKLLDDMYGAKTQIKGLANLWNDKVVDTNNNLIKDTDDVLSLIKSMPETFDADPETKEVELNELARAFLTPKKFVSGKQYGFIDESDIASQTKAVKTSLDKIETNTLWRGVTEIKSSEGTAAGLKTDDDYWAAIGGKAGTLFDGGKTQFEPKNEISNRDAKWQLQDKIFKSFNYGEVGNASTRVKTYLDEANSLAPGNPENDMAREAIMKNILDLIHAKEGDDIISSVWGYGFKKGSGMEKSDYEPSKFGHGGFLGTASGDKAMSRSNHTLSMIETWLRFDNMYPNHSEQYNEIYNEGIWNLGN